ncbi:FecR domain-containing protein [Xanthobacter sp. V4C-4]|uniref:FecR family protein n=1 Tax=Xanthobacter cornucopiae TaxID=3119924 RepID=UPI003727E1D4
MPISTPARLLASVASLALVAAADAAANAPLAQQTVGTAAAVNPRSTGVGASGTRVLELGAPIVHRERVQTSDSGSVQVVFLDKTTLNIGPRSDLLIDEFVYDPAAGTGSMALSLARGTLRFVGGNASHTGGAVVKTPVATIGIRGGVAAFRVGDGRTRAILQFGTLTVRGPGGQTVELRRPGFMVDVGPDGISAPARVPQADMDALIAETRSQSGQTGGRRQPTPDIQVGAASGHPCARPAQGQTTMDLASVTCRSVNTRLEGEADQIARDASQQGQAQVLIPIERPPDPPPPYGYGG